MAGDEDIKNKQLKGHKAGARKYNVHLDGYNMLPYWAGKVSEGPRKEMFYFTDDGQLSALRYGQWKVMPAAAYVGKFIGTFKEYPPRQKPGSFNLDHVLQSLQTNKSGAN